MIVGYHITIGAYGFWLPNDPRGSWSTYVGSWELLRYGSSTKTTETRSLAHCKHDHSLRLAAKKALKHPATLFSGLQARAIGRGFANYAKKASIPIWACAILPDHIHLVTGLAHIPADKLAIQLKLHATRQLLEEKIHPFQGERNNRGKIEKCFSRREWKVYLEPDDVRHAIKYVEGNPMKEGLKSQKWKFVVPLKD